MSSGILKPNYQNFPKIDLSINVLFKFDKSEGQKCKFQFISELITMLFKQKDGQDTFQNFSNLIALSLKEPAEKFADILFSGNNVIDFSKNNDKRAQYFSYKLDQKDKYLLMLNRIRSIFNNCPNLTNKQKFEYCAIERYFMKSYLKCL